MDRSFVPVRRSFIPDYRSIVSVRRSFIPDDKASTLWEDRDSQISTSRGAYEEAQERRRTSTFEPLSSSEPPAGVC